MSSLLRTPRLQSPPLSKILFAALGLIAIAGIPARAAGQDILPTPDGVAQLEQQASRANPRDQVFLYSQLAHSMAQLADREIADGENVQATATLQQVNRYVHLIHLRLAHDAKRLKAAQELMHNTTYRLAEVLHLVSGEDRAPVQETLKQLDQLNEELLTQVFTQ
jgi:hypothetical protein